MVIVTEKTKLRLRRSYFSREFVRYAPQKQKQYIDRVTCDTINNVYTTSNRDGFEVPVTEKRQYTLQLKRLALTKGVAFSRIETSKTSQWKIKIHHNWCQHNLRQQMQSNQNSTWRVLDYGRLRYRDMNEKTNNCSL